MNIIHRIIKSFLDDDCFTLASNISFCAILAIIPLIMIIVSVAGYFLGSQAEVFNQLVEAMVAAIPIGKQKFMNNLQPIVDSKSSFGIVGILTLLFIATILVSSIEKAFDIIFRTVKRRNFFHSRLMGVGVIFGGTVLFSIPVVAKLADSILRRLHTDFQIEFLFAADIFMFIVTFLAFVMVCVVIPNQKVYIRYAAVGGVVFSLGLGLARIIFKSYTSFALARYNLIYGSFTAAILFIMWIYYMALILLLAAEITSSLQDVRKGLAGSREVSMNGEQKNK